MAELTIDPTEYTEGEFSPEEQEAIAVGEQLAQEQEALLAGKFKSAEDLENAYIELQKRFSKGERETPDEQPVDEPVEEETVEDEEEREPIDSSILDQIWEAARQGEVPPELTEQLQQLTQEEIVELYLEQRANAESQKNLTPETVDGLKQSVGGAEQYKQIITWAADNLPPDQVELYDQVMSNGDPASMWFAIQALNFIYKDNAGHEGELLTGKPAVDSTDKFRSQAEVIRAMQDPRYDSDPAYRRDVFDKLERSDIDF